MKNPSACILFSFVWLFTVTEQIGRLYAQETTSPYFSEQHYVPRIWDNTKGLPVNTVFKTIIDQTGYLWAATEEGLIRFDGLAFKTFNQENISDIRSPLFYDVILSENGDIWAANIHSLVRIQDNQFTVFDARDQIEGSWINTILETRQGEIWIGTHEGKLLKLTGDHIGPIPQWNVDKPGMIDALLKTPEGILVGTQKGLYRYSEDLNKFSAIPGFEHSKIRALVRHPDGAIWIGTADEGVFRLNNDEITSFDITTGLKSNQVNALFVDHDAKVWVGMDKGGVILIDNNRLVSFRDTQFASNEIRHIHVAGNGTIWLAPMGSGLIQMIPAEVRMMSKADGLCDDTILPIYEDEEGTIWAGTAGAGVSRIDDERVTCITTRDGLADDLILGLGGFDGYTYIGTTKGLNCYNKKKKKVVRTFTVNDGLTDDIIYAIYKDSKGTVWVAGASGGIYQLVDHKNLRPIAVPESYHKAEFINIFEDSKGNIWFGTYATGALKMEQNGRFTAYPVHDHAPSGMVSSFFEDEAGDIWLGTHDALLLLENDSFRIFNRTNGLQFNGAHALIPDDLGYLWMSSNYGLQRVSLKDLLSLKGDSTHTKKIPVRYFDTSDGMANNEANGGIFPAGWKMKNGEIWVPTIEGIAIINPAEVRARTSELKVNIAHIRYGDKEFHDFQNVEIPAGVYNLEIQYGSFDFRKPHTINYHYRLKNLNSEWNLAGNRNTAYFTSLNPGHYIFEVKAEQFGRESEISSIGFTVAPFFHQTYWFRGLLLCALFLSGFFARQFYAKHQLGKEMKLQIQEQTHELKNRNRLLENALSDIAHQNKILKEIAWVQSHRLRGPLSKILGFTAVLKDFDHFTNVKKSKESLLEEIEKAAKEMDLFIRKLNDKIENTDDNNKNS
ncbi:ligand-binding sensor domain-containing protein [Negadavirga shengliensis]|uniref:Two-component regulator propeller domain-containing protein n=1 Tax=Negadavirga shengliensis TaxID=1389218 RepID=A0ABV9SX10_9BACT